MPKTITVRLEDGIYDIFKKAAEGEKRTISNYMEYATLTYLTNEIYVSDEEMEEIKQFAPNLRKGLQEAKKGKYKLVK